MDKHSPIIRIWVDADACPSSVKDIIIKASKRSENIAISFVANRSIWRPPGSKIDMIVVDKTPDAADHYIIKHLSSDDIVITADVPLAGEVVQKGAIALDPKGHVYDQGSIGDRLAMRNLMDQLRSSGLAQSFHKQMSAQDVKLFAASFDKIITRRLKKNR